MKTLKSIASLVLLAALAVAQLPIPSPCFMGTSLPNAVCTMPCCKTTPVPSPCPLVRKAVSLHDVLRPSSLMVVPQQPLTAAFHSAVLQLPFLSTPLRQWIGHLTETLVFSPPAALRAPPADYVLFSA